jgi:hypothetical protein
MKFYECPGCKRILYVVPRCPEHRISLKEKSLREFVRENTR